MVAAELAAACDLVASGDSVLSGAKTPPPPCRSSSSSSSSDEKEETSASASASSPSKADVVEVAAAAAVVWTWRRQMCLSLTRRTRPAASLTGRMRLRAPFKGLLVTLSGARGARR